MSDTSDKSVRGLSPGPFSRNYYLLAFRTPPVEERGTVVVQPSEFRGTAERVCSTLGVLYGKRFDLHGPIESSGYYHTPDLDSIRPVEFSQSGPFNHQPRCDLEIDLNLAHFEKVASLVTNHALDEHFKNVFFAAARFYRRSLLVFDLEPDVAYLDLITCGEILAEYFNYSDEVLYGAEILGMLSQVRESTGKPNVRLISELKTVNEIPTEGKGLIIVAEVDKVLHFRIFDGMGMKVEDTDERKLVQKAEQIEALRQQLESLWPVHELPRMTRHRVVNALMTILDDTMFLNGERIAKEFKARMRQIKRRFTKTVIDMLNDYFFTNTETVHGKGKLERASKPHPGFNNKSITIEDRIKEAYNLRSRYIHSGIEFARFVRPHPVHMNETQLGWFGAGTTGLDSDLAKALSLAPTYLGLERIMRYCLVRFLHLNGTPIDPRLDGPPEPPLRSGRRDSNVKH